LENLRISSYFSSCTYGKIPTPATRQRGEIHHDQTLCNTESLEENISELNNNFSRIGIKIEKDDVKTECRHKLERIYPVDREKFSWLSNWINTY
jgi:hypothetical protein